MNNNYNSLAKTGLRGAAFTLIELLMVLAVIGVLAAILIPVTGGVRESATRTKKQSGYRQYHIANTMYASDNKGMSCPARDSSDAAEDWRFYLKPYLADAAQDKAQARESEIYFDPFFEAYDPDSPGVTGIGLNLYLRRPDQPSFTNVANATDGSGGLTLLSAITYPKYRILVGDVTAGEALIENTGRMDTTRHDNKGMFVLFDGSVVFYDAAEAVLAFNDPSALRSR